MGTFRLIEFILLVKAFDLRIKPVFFRLVTSVLLDKLRQDLLLLIYFPEFILVLPLIVHLLILEVLKPVALTPSWAEGEPLEEVAGLRGPRLLDGGLGEFPGEVDTGIAFTLAFVRR